MSKLSMATNGHNGAADQQHQTACPLIHTFDFFAWCAFVSDKRRAMLIKRAKRESAKDKNKGKLDLGVESPKLIIGAPQYLKRVRVRAEIRVSLFGGRDGGAEPSPCTTREAPRLLSTVSQQFFAHAPIFSAGAPHR